jgi:protein-L-isoaspartate(D-aspartate) O-methyltransferase
MGGLLDGIRDERVRRAVAEVDRAAFVPYALRRQAWADRALPIGDGQTISQPSLVAHMCELLELRGDEVVLDVGTGSGYHAAVLARLARRVVSIERHPALAARASALLGAAVEVVVGDGTRGWPPAAPYDAINVAAAAREVPRALVAQLAEGGRMVVPVGDRLLLVRRAGGAVEAEALDHVRFVPLVGS